jgi:hypothetical protein
MFLISNRYFGHEDLSGDTLRSVAAGSAKHVDALKNQDVWLVLSGIECAGCVYTAFAHPDGESRA